ncbi:16S rRNA (uracil(1498)-N(3))-methyltransferase [Mesonia sp. K7]|uniref:16S rRNA (uracil(1498)-N(3))-methyltransferase n=1 Tax=Mesonia sp. K7 TaxID=2218606 RepID=UPI000DA89732|nr:16S rRNA (uracil(1498)-N(3))-methyltransferase [Mesonia sp. K7]PZD76842.1 16S rRNA (uracil(1498)-N(3))-methyltransferase [Mesonia sp. K7]
MQLFFNSNIKVSDKEVFFDREESKHIVKVLRKQEGDILHVTNGLGSLFVTEIILADIKKCKVKIIEIITGKPKNYRLHIAIAPTKMNDRFEWFLEKATEIGIDEITPLLCEHSERKVLKLDRAERVLQSALKQSLQYTLPKINEMLSFEEFIQQQSGENLFIAHCGDDHQKQFLKDVVLKNQTYTLLIGPEGDFSENEIKSALSQNFKPVSLSHTRLRTETAAIAATHTFALLNLE